MKAYIEQVYLNLLGTLAEELMGMAGKRAQENASKFVFGPQCGELNRWCIGAGITVKQFRKEMIELM